MSRRVKARIKTDVDIVVPVYGGLAFLMQMTKSLFEHDAGASFHLYVVDDATPPEKEAAEIQKYMRELEGSHDNVTYIQNRVNGGYAKTNNIGFSKGRSEYVLMLNSDTIIMHDNWLADMLKPLQENPIVGVVGPKLLFFDGTNDPKRPGGTTQHAGVAFNILKQPYHIFIGWPPDHPRVCERRIMQAVTGACILTRRNIIRRLKGLAEIYTKGNFEDVEFCIHAGMLGFVTLYEPSVTLRHYGGGSNNVETAERNYQIFKLRNDQLVAWDDFRYY